MNRPIISLTVVIKGPVANAGSILYLLSVNGTKVPNNAANTITANNEILTVILKLVPNPNKSNSNDF